MLDLQSRLDTAQRIAAKASSVVMVHFRQSLTVRSKSDNSPVTLASDGRTLTAATAELYADLLELVHI